MTTTVVLADANVLFSRVLRDYLMYAALDGLIALRWSPGILDEMERTLAERRKLSAVQAARLRSLMEQALPLASVTPEDAEFVRITHAAMPDEADRHVLAAAIAADANVLCTLNTRDFPQAAADASGVSVLTPDALLNALVTALPEQMAHVHASVVASMPRSDAARTLDALERAGAPMTAAALRASASD